MDGNMKVIVKAISICLFLNFTVSVIFFLTMLSPTWKIGNTYGAEVVLYVLTTVCHPVAAVFLGYRYGEEVYPNGGSSAARFKYALLKFLYSYGVLLFLSILCFFLYIEHDFTNSFYVARMQEEVEYGAVLAIGQQKYYFSGPVWHLFIEQNFNARCLLIYVLFFMGCMFRKCKLIVKSSPIKY